MAVNYGNHEHRFAATAWFGTEGMKVSWGGVFAGVLVAMGVSMLLAALGIADVNKPDWGDSVGVRAGEVPVFWACGVTPQAVALASKPAFMITHSPGHMFITDLPNHTLAAL